MITERHLPQRELLKTGPGRLPTTFTRPGSNEAEAFGRIRCPLCRWQPASSSVWCCLWFDTPEPFFEACGTIWNTFLTRGRCPGCSHQWRWTLCLQCAGWSLHEDWYDVATA
jgi:hypothetical protein